MLRSSSDDDAISRLRRVQNDALCELNNAFAIHQVQLVRVDASLVTPAQKRFEEPVVERIVSLLSTLNLGLGAICQAGDLLRQQLVPQLPSQMLRKLLGDFAPAASVLPLNGDDSNHSESPQPLLALGHSIQTSF